MAVARQTERDLQHNQEWSSWQQVPSSFHPSMLLLLFLLLVLEKSVTVSKGGCLRKLRGTVLSLYLGVDFNF